MTAVPPRSYLSQVFGIEKHESVHAELLGPVAQAVDDQSPDNGMSSAQHILSTAGGPGCGSGKFQGDSGPARFRQGKGH